MSNYSDPNNYSEKLEILYKLESKEEIKEYIDTILPGWFQGSAKEYSDDYPHLKKNWRTLCSMNGVTPQKILVVREIKFDDSHKMVQGVCDFLTKKGYVVRREGELVACEECGKVIPNAYVWKILRQKNLPCPRLWSPNCTRCEEKEEKEEEKKIK